MTHLGLGTVQLGVPYGNNAKGPLMPMTEAAAILDLAVASGIRFFDTAQAYGESEERLGQLGLAQKASDIEISTKVPRVGPEVWKDLGRYSDFLREVCRKSRERLRVNDLGLLQFHQCDVEFLVANSVRVALADLVATGECKAIGISVYEPDEAYAALEIPTVSALQVPLNVVDDRFLSPELLKAYKNRGIRLIARSIFMQGILLPHAPLPPVKKQRELGQLRERIQVAIGTQDSLEICLRFLLKNLHEVVDTALIGVDSCLALEANLSAARAATLASEQVALDVWTNAREFASANRLLNPALWNQ